MKIVFLDSHTLILDNDIDFSPLTVLGDFETCKININDNFLDVAKDADILITNKILISKETIENLDKLKLVCVIATGYNNVDIKSARNRDIPVLNVPDYGKYSVSQHVFSLILNLATKSFLYYEDIRNNEWQKSKNFTLLKYPTFELAGKVLGIIGFGAVGREVAKIALGFNMRVVFYDIRSISDTSLKNYSLEEVLKESDIVSLHCPLNTETRNMVNKNTINLMKQNAILINTSRGGIIDENALKEALNSGRIAGAGIDVLSEEPPKNGNPLLENVKNIIITPHSAWSTVEARQRMVNITAENIKSFMEGNLKNLVN